jgi:hypothetical protein
LARTVLILRNVAHTRQIAPSKGYPMRFPSLLPILLALPLLATSGCAAAPDEDEPQGTDEAAVKRTRTCEGAEPASRSAAFDVFRNEDFVSRL